MTPEEFEVKMQEIKDQHEDRPDVCIDREILHEKMDNLLCEMLIELGYGDGIRIFQETDKW